MLRRVLRWLWRRFCLVVVGVALALGSGALLPSAPAVGAAPVSMRAFASVPHHAAAPAAPTPAEQARARERAARARWLLLGSVLYQGALVLGFLLAGGTRWLARLTARFGGHWVPAIFVVFGLLTLAGALLTLPLDYYTGFIFPHQYGLSAQTPLAWLRDYLVSGGVGLLFGVPLVMLLYALLRRAPRTWWLWLAGASVPISIFLMLIQPVFVAPLFNKFSPLHDAGLRHDILALAHRQGIRTDEVYQVDASRQSRAVNAYVNGFGPTQRIVLYDTLLDNFTHDEIMFVMAHEIGHYVLGHIVQGIAFAVLGALVGGFALYGAAHAILRRWGGMLGFTHLGHPASYPLLMALGMALSLLSLPIANGFSRHLEWQADHYALRVYPHPKAGISAFHKLARFNVVEEDPPRWAEVVLYSHPSLARRIAALEAAEPQTQ